ncbi:MAG: hypothetical protein CR986_09780 [Ignavibacteriae bacterium]|nr:MAG: hypothetical protein CR986_09780 [Ignavibacteriota bacterium]
MKDELLNRIIAVAYNDASIIEKFKIYRLAKKNKEVKQTLDEYKNAASETRNISPDNCPDKIIENIKVRTNYRPLNRDSLSDDLFSFVFGRPKFVSGLVVLFLAALISTLFLSRKDIHKQYTQKEIQIADKEVRHSLNIVANILKETSKTVEEDVLAKRVSAPIHKSINFVNNYLQGENTNGKVN